MIPCKTCLKAPICRQLGYRRLLGRCEEVALTLYRNGSISTNARKKNFKHNAMKLFKELNPTEWTIICRLHMRRQGFTIKSTKDLNDKTERFWKKQRELNKKYKECQNEALKQLIESSGDHIETTLRDVFKTIDM